MGYAWGLHRILRSDQDIENAWKNDFNRFISGMHSAVSVHVVEGMPEDQRLAEYRRRLRDEEGAVQNLHFGYMLLLCAIDQVQIITTPSCLIKP